MEIGPTDRFCKCINESVHLTAKVVVSKPGPLTAENIVGVQKWLDCNKKKSCGKKCNYFYPSSDCDCNACDERDLHTFP